MGGACDTIQNAIEIENSYSEFTWPYYAKRTLPPSRGGGTPLYELNGDVRPARVCFSGFLS